MGKRAILISVVLAFLLAGCAPSGYSPPKAHQQSVSVDEDSSIDITLTASIWANDSVTWTIVNDPSHGSLAGTPPDSIYSPEPDFNGSDSFSFLVDDWYHASNMATVFITINPVNDPPSSTNATIITSINMTSVGITPTVTDIDNGESFTFSILTQPLSGFAYVLSNRIYYTPNQDISGSDFFSYRAFDSGNESVDGTATVTILAPQPDIWFVDLDATGTADGRSWANALSHPQNGIDMAVPGDEVWVAGGTYASMDTVGSMPVLAMKNGVDIFGGFEGSETTLSERDLSSNTTVLDGEYLVDNVVVGASSARLDGFVITGGYSETSSGAGMLNDGVSGLMVINSVFIGNETTTDEGGGMHNNSAEIEIGNCVFTANSALRGGGINFRRSTAFIVNTTVVGNTASDQGGGIYNRDDIISLVNSIVYDNAPDQIFDKGKEGETVVTYSDIQQDGYAGADGNINADPVFSDDDYRLDSTSPCLEAGDNTAVMSTSYFYDLDGNDRILDGDGDDTATVDMGAYEYIP